MKIEMFAGHSGIDYDALRNMVATLRNLVVRANGILPKNPHLEGYRDDLVITLAHAEKALEQF